MYSYPPYQRLFLHVQPEDVPFHGDRDPLVTWNAHYYSFIRFLLSDNMTIAT
jgi:hypothetical protein